MQFIILSLEMDVCQVLASENRKNESIKQDFVHIAWGCNQQATKIKTVCTTGATMCAT